MVGNQPKVFVAQKPKKQLKKFWRVLIVLLIAMSLPLSLVVLKLTLDFRSQAGPTENPQEIIVSNITDSSATVSFETPNVKSSGIVSYWAEGISEKASFDTRSSGDISSERYNLHYHTLTGLKPDTSYNFKITIGEGKYEESNYKFKTRKTLSSPPAPNPIFGKVVGTNFPEGIVYVHIQDGTEDSSSVSTLLPTSGAYSLDLGNAVFADNRSTKGKKIYVFVNAGSAGKGSSSTTNPTEKVPDINLDQSGEKYSPKSNPINAAGNSSITATQSPTKTSTPKPTNTSTPKPTSTNTVSPTEISSPTTVITDKPTAIPTETPQNQDANNMLFKLDNSQADSDIYSPKDIFISNVTEKSATINWRTTTPMTGSVAYGIDDTPSTETLDKRDTNTKNKRYTHSVDLFLPSATSDTPINFRILSDELEYPSESTSFTFKLPPLIDTPPSPTSKEGEISYNFTPTNKDDFLVYGQMDGVSTFVSSVANDGINWTLPVGNSRDETLQKMYSIGETSSLSVYAIGDKNSHGEGQGQLDDEIISIATSQGIGFTNIKDADKIPPNGSISGFSSPSSTVEIKLDSDSTQVQSNEKGEWVYKIPKSATSGNKTLTISDDRDIISIEIEVKSVEDLPVTAIEDYLIYIPAFLSLSLGIFLYRLSKKNTTWDSI